MTLIGVLVFGAVVVAVLFALLVLGTRVRLFQPTNLITSGVPRPPRPKKTGRQAGRIVIGYEDPFQN